ncbi:DNA cytosine methyltransferase [Peribacillus simplex]|uniref:DNA cytosine methyltransferase n=1 Tax=Peribacillus simplex TaxID=1478 RepID=UPI00333BFA34
MYAVDLFCGAGGFSEGITQAGFHIVFSSDRSQHVMETYMNRHEQLGLIHGQNTHFELADIRDLYGSEILEKVNRLPVFRNSPFQVGQIDAIFGGPPCQGFSRAGRRDPNDPRNMLFREYLRIISEIQPRYVVMENVSGFMDTRLSNFLSLSNEYEYDPEVLVSEILQNELQLIGYNVLQPRLLDSSDYGVPQKRKRAIFIAYRNGEKEPRYPEPTTPELYQKVTVLQAIGDLVQSSRPDNEISSYINNSRKGRTKHVSGNTIEGENIPVNHELSTHSLSVKERFSLFLPGESTRMLESRIRNEGIDLRSYPNLLMECVFYANKNSNQKILKEIALEFELKENADSNLWLINTLKLISQIFVCEKSNDLVGIKNLIKKLTVRLKCSEKIAEAFYQRCKENLNREVTVREIVGGFLMGDVNSDLMRSLLTKKNSRIKLNVNSVSPTMVTLPDDFINPFEPRILTVREMARLQSFDDSFKFLGKRTTGGELRKEEVPQYTQVGNAVPPLLGKAIAMEIRKALEEE